MSFVGRRQADLNLTRRASLAPKSASGERAAKFHHRNLGRLKKRGETAEKTGGLGVEVI